MADWEQRTAVAGRLELGRAYTKAEVAAALGVAPPRNSRDWGGLVSFANAECLFVTLEKDPARYSAEHRYDDRFKGDTLYWDSRASHDKKSAHVQRLRRCPLVLGFARSREKAGGKTLAFTFIGELTFENWWGERPVRFTWRLKSFPNGLGGSPELDALVCWDLPGTRSAPSPISDREIDTRVPIASESGAPNPPSGLEGIRSQALVNRYERDPRARRECIESHGLVCHVCGFNFEAKYGSIGSGFVFVHHRVPVAVRARDGEYDLDPVRDLVPLCGNCHAIVHRRGVPSDTMPGLTLVQAARLLELRRAASVDSWDSLE